MINMNSLAKEITLKEGGKVNLPIGQVKECLRITLEMLAVLDTVEVERLLRRVKRRMKKFK